GFRRQRRRGDADRVELGPHLIGERRRREAAFDGTAPRSATHPGEQYRDHYHTTLRDCHTSPPWLPPFVLMHRDPLVVTASSQALGHRSGTVRDSTVHTYGGSQGHAARWSLGWA